jgi:hypothetical protein
MNTSTLAIVNKFKELLCHFSARGGEYAMLSASIKIVYARMLMMQSSVQNAATETVGCKHASHERPELNISVVEL